jgi:hypothetical protein
MSSSTLQGAFYTESQTKKLNADWKILPAQSEAVHGTRWRGPARGEGNA